MEKKDVRSRVSTELRLKAEAKYSQNHTHVNLPQTEADLNWLVQELQIHQIELEMQNEELLQARDQVEALLERFADLYDFAPVGYFTLGRDGTVSQANINGALMLGVERARMVGRKFGLFVDKMDQYHFDFFLEDVFRVLTKHVCEIRLRSEGNEPHWVQMEANIGKDGQECRMVITDIQARKQAEIALQHLSIHDALTNLYNRSYFLESLERYERGRHFPISILTADVDQLKRINDQKGNAVGDEILKRVAKVLVTAFRVEDEIARIGGDKFGVILPHTGSEAAEVAMDRLNDVLQEHNDSYITEDPLKLSVGISTATEYGYPLKETLKEAEKDMKHRKQG